MSKNIVKPQTLKGFRDFLPNQLSVRKKVIEIFSQVFEKYGFEPLETPALEYQETLLGKYGEEAEKLMYLFKDPGQRTVGLKYDLTVPLARVIGQYPQIPKPFKRYQIQSVWRADRPQKGRYREITQCDVDSVGISSPLADAEIIAIIFEALKAVNFKQFTIRINSRQVIFQVMESAGVDSKRYLTAIQSIDKLDKKPKEEVEKELESKKFSNAVIKNVFENIKKAKPDSYLTELLKYVKLLAVDKNFYVFDPKLARGLDYYTGPIYETIVTEPKIGSITGGGRYDDLLSMFVGEPTPATGTTIGLDRTVDVINDLNLWPNFQKQSTKVLITIFSSSLLEKSLDLVKKMRCEKINTELYLNQTAKLDRQLKYADKKGIPYVVIIGPDEVKKNVVKLKNMKTSEQLELNQTELIKKLKKSG